jgi:ribonuclease R
MQKKRRTSLPAEEARLIPTREIILATLRAARKPMLREDLYEALGLADETDQSALERRLTAMLKDGILLDNRHGELGLADKMDLIAGMVIGHADGFGFVRPENGSEDLFLPPATMRRVLHGDRVLVSVTSVDPRGRREGLVVEILSRRSNRVVGRYLQEAGFGMVVPDDKRLVLDLRIPPQKSMKAKPGDVVVAEIVEWPDTHRLPFGHILRVLGPEVLPLQAVDLAIEAYDLPDEFPKDVLAAATKVAKLPTKKKLAEREDLRELPLVTIDGEDARDFDDALWAEKTRTGFRLIVAIADVASYVTPGDLIDVEARKRGTSVYFPRRVLPMLPEALSNGMCSLKPQEDRLCLCCELTIDHAGQTKKARFFKGLMRSARRLTYTQVWNAVGREDEAARESVAEVLPQLESLHALFLVMLQARMARGALDFDGQEVRFSFNEQGEVEAVAPFERNDAHRLVEECMIAANVAAARYLRKHKMPTLYRIHPGPAPSRYEEARIYMSELGIELPPHDELSTLALAGALQKAKTRPDRALLEAMMLRLQSLAVYHPECTGHFGLALQEYAHFTSPIRRYPDLMVHRAIHHLIDGGTAKTYGMPPGKMFELGQQTSLLERRADEAAREVDERIKCSWIAERVGQDFDGIVTAVTSFGAFIELLDTRISGLLHVTQLKQDYYHFDSRKHRLVGERNRGVVQLAQKLKVKVLKVDTAERKIDLALVGELPKLVLRDTASKPAVKKRGSYDPSHPWRKFRAKGSRLSMGRWWVRTCPDPCTLWHLWVRTCPDALRHSKPEQRSHMCEPTKARLGHVENSFGTTRLSAVALVGPDMSGRSSTISLSNCIQTKVRTCANPQQPTLFVCRKIWNQTR